ncbi:MAG: S8 family peptidase [Myxococcaceae bacterium]|nr:S8 family peptidase [Myxococcaceae bacterium]
MMALLAAGCSKGSSPREQPMKLNDLHRPTYVTSDLADDERFHVGRRIVVDFVDGTTKAQFDEYEKDWGIDLELADQEEGVDSAITVSQQDVEDVDGLLAQIRGRADVEVAEPLMRFQSSFVPDDPQYEKQWNLKMIDMPKAWEETKGKGVVVAVLDTGIAYEDYEDFRRVPDLKGVRFTEGFDFVNNDKHPNDDHGHGTHVAGTIAQATNNGEGVAGIAFEATLMPVKVLDHFGSGNSAAISDAVRWAADHGAKVINMSLGGGGRSAVFENAVAYARKKGVVVVCAAGNTGLGHVEFPAAYPASVAVAAVGPSGSKAPYSSFGKELDIAAPGGDKTQGDEAGILQNTIDPQDVSKSVYAAYQGTSMAAPHVAAVAALLVANGAKNPDQVEAALFKSAKMAAGQHGWTEQYGHGILSAMGALTALGQMGPDWTPALDATPVAVNVGANGEAQAGTVGAMGISQVDWKPLAWAGGFLVFVLLTLGRKERPGYFNIIFHPGFAIPLVLTTVGAFALRWVVSPTEVGQLAVLPIPDWLQRIIFGRGTLANPMVYSAALPIVLSVVAISLKGLRPIAAGLSIGFAAILAYSAWAHAPALAWLPFTFMAVPWLVLNAIICLFVARALLRKEAR